MKNIYKILTLSLIILTSGLSTMAQTSVEFTAATANVTEAGVSVDLTVAITNEDVNATMVDVVLTGGSAVDIDNYTTQTVTFPTTSATNETVTIMITDDMDIEAAETLTFTLQNVSGGNAAVIGAQATTDIVIVDNDITASDLIINEVHADPASSTPGDANGDGVRSASEDEFIELVNTGVGDLDISGYEIFDTNSTVLSRHVFPASTVVPAGGAIVVFGGGTPTGTFGDAIVQTASTGSVGTTNSSETLIVQDASDNTLIYFTYGAEGNENQSITRDPDITGEDTPMTKHSEVATSGGILYSPGTKVDGLSPFATPTTTSVKFSATSANETEDGISFDLTISIANEDVGIATTADVILVSGNAVNINNYTTQAVSFTAGSALDQTITVTITDDAVVETAETFVFELQNVAGGNAAVLGTQVTFYLTVLDDDITATDLVINEIHADPEGTILGDANGDGIRSGSDDEFIELVNNGVGDLDISGYEIFDTNSSVNSRHIFPASTVVPAGGAIVVFGGGTPIGSFGGSIVQTASSGGVGTTNSSESLIIQDGSNNTVIYYTYGAEGNGNQSITRDPDITGGDTPMSQHSVATGSGGSLWSPGTMIDGSAFIAPSTTEVNFSSASASVNEADGTYDIEVTIASEDAGVATTVEVALTSGAAADVNTYATQMVTFPANDATNQMVTLTITDDTDIEGDEDLVFTLQNVAGGNSASIGAQNTLTLTIEDNDFTPTDLVLNEIHADPHGSNPDGDANGDGVRSASDDEFIELVNTGVADLDISGYEIFDTNSSLISRHVFPASTIIPAGGAIVVFGGGTPTGSFGNSIVQTASSGSIGATNSSEEFIIEDAADNIIISYTYGAEAGDDQSITRDPDISGGDTPMTKHSIATGSGGALFSPGTKIDGSFFIVPTTTEVNFASATASVNEADGTYDIVVSIAGEDVTNATTVEVALTSGNAADVNTYATQMVTFLANDATSQIITLTITDDSDIEGDEDLLFTLQNVSGGNTAVIGAQSTIIVTIVDNDFAGTDLVVNEYMPWPAGSDGSAAGATRFDANGNGSYEFGFDEYIELVNSGAGNLDISGWKINDGIDRHIFPASTVIPAGGAIVVFGGDTPSGTFGNSIIQTASESTSLGMSNGGDALTIKDDTDATRLSFNYGAESRAVAFARSPDISGAFIAHPALASFTNEDATDAQASPGLKIDGSFFIEVTSTEVQFSTATASVNEADGTIDVMVSILGEDGSNATTADVVLTSGDAADIASYTTQTVTFPAGDATSQTVTLTITDDSDVEGNEDFVLSLQNIAGGNAASIGTQETHTLTIVDNDFDGTDLVINEFLPFPSTTSIDDPNEVDANGDGALGGTSDEFVELVNSGTGDLDISGWKISDGVDRHIFPASTVIPSGGAIVVFAGAATGTFGNSIVQTASTGGLGLSNSGDTFSINDDSDNTRLTHTYPAATVGVAFTRSPDVTGSDTFVAHSINPSFLNDGGSGATTSPGTKVDGSFFIEVTSTEVQFSSATASVNEADGTVDVTVSILGEDGSNATTADVVLTSGDAADLASYTTQTVTFSAGDATSQIVTLTITDDSDVEGNEDFVFSLQNIAGGNSAAAGTQDTHTLTVIDDDFAGTTLVLNEFLPYPSSTSIEDPNEVDANGDGTFGGTSDEFVELVNSGVTDLDISGWKINDGADRHVFPTSTIVPAGGAIVVFAGAPVGVFGNSVVQTASSGGLGLSNGGDTFSINDETDNTRITHTYIAASPGIAQTRSPDVTGNDVLIDHPANATILNNGGTAAAISPGTKVDGTFFIEVTNTQVQFGTGNASVNEGDGTYDLAINIVGEDAVNATTVDVAIKTGDASDINDYTTQSLTFPAGSNDAQMIILTLTDDGDIEGDENIEFELSNVAGGDNAAFGGQTIFTLTIVDNDFAPSDLVLNEFLAYPSTTTLVDPNEVDANGDGTFSGIDDEFIELVNAGTGDLDITGWQILDGSSVRHIFGPTVLPGGGAAVVFAGGNPTGTFGGANVSVASEGLLSFTNSGDDVIVKDNTGETKISFSYTSPSIGVSFTKNPDITATNLTNHPDLNGVKISPGTMVDGTPFTVDNSTKVEFVSALGGTSETNSTPFEVALLITNPDATNATTADIVLVTVGAESDFSFTTQTVTFPAGSSDEQTISISVINDADLEGDELFAFAIENVTGGDNARTGIKSTFNFFVLDDDVPLIFNEIHADPSGDLAGDANNDGIRDASADEFIEVINQSLEPVDISGWEYHDSSDKRHVFQSGTVLDPGRAVVVFGGGIPTGQFGGSDVQLASEGIGLGLTNSGEAIQILEGSELKGGTIYGDDANNNQSVTRSPDITGGYAIHTEAEGYEGRLYSPGTKVDGGLFINIVTGVNKQFVSNAILYPNPASDHLNIRLDEKLVDFQLILRSVNGGEAITYQFYSTDVMNIDVSQLQKGVYVYTLKSKIDQVNQTGKLIIR